MFRTVGLGGRAVATLVQWWGFKCDRMGSHSYSSIVLRSPLAPNFSSVGPKQFGRGPQPVAARTTNSTRRVGPKQCNNRNTTQGQR
eukprot:1346641-Pyramimonas_sp.AAC.1